MDSEGTKEKKEVEVKKTKEEKLLREVIVKIGLEKVDMQEGIIVEALLNNGTIGLVMSSKFARK